jgi:hypothetical protein
MSSSAPRLTLALLLFAAARLQAAPALEPGAPIPAFAAAGRDYAVTPEKNFAWKSFVTEVTLTVKSGHGGNGCAFLGLGSGKPDPKAFGEPTAAPSLVFRFAPNDFGGGRIMATVDGKTAEETHLGDGTHRVRLTWDAAKKRALLQVHRDVKPGEAFAPKISLFVPEVPAAFGEDTHFFVGGADGQSFSDYTARAATTAEIAAMPMSDSFPKDASARTWLPVTGASAQTKGDAATDAFLKDLNASLRPVVCWYKGAELQATRAFTNDVLSLPNSKWASSVKTTPVEGDATARDLTVSVTVKDGGSVSSGLAAAFDFTNWRTENYVLIPASVYNGNRNRIVGRGYAEGLDAQDYYRKDLPLTHGSVPCLALEADKPSKLEVNSSNATTPSVVVFDKKTKRGFILLAEQGGRGANGDFLRKSNGEILDNAFAVEESADRKRATIVVGAPGVREKQPHFIGFGASPDRGLALKTGDTVTLNLRVYDFPADGIPAVLEKFMSVRKALTGPNDPRELLPKSEHHRRMVAFTDGKYLNGKDAKFYMPENGDWIAFGWIGGWMNTYQMLAQGDAARLERVTNTFDFGLKAQEPSGWFHYSIRQDGNTASREPKPDMNLTRTHGDILYWMIKQFDLLKAQGRGDAVKPAWESSMKKLADAAVTTWKRDGQWGKMVNVKTGEVSEYNSSGGVMLIGGLALASDYFKDSRYLAVAKEAANFYYERDFVKQGQTTGACADILQNADSETAFAFTNSLATLYDVTGDKVWLEKARNAANLAATWTVSYDYELPKFTALGASGLKFTGAVWASTQNKHAAPGYCTGSGDSLLKIYRATGDTRYAELIRDILRAHADAIHGGGGTERLTYCDADSRGDNPGGANGWVITNGAMMTLELPGLYLRTDADKFYVFDSVQARVLSRDAAGVKVEITNPTKFDAQVAVLAENAAGANKPLGPVAYLKWPKVPVKAGETKVVTASPDGRVTDGR